MIPHTPTDLAILNPTTLDLIAHWYTYKPSQTDAHESDPRPMDTPSLKSSDPTATGKPEWPVAVYKALKASDIGQMCYVPDAGHTSLINLFLEDQQVTSNVLTTEEEGIAIAAGAWLGGVRSVVLMQSSGVGNCVNMLSLPVQSRSPLLMLVTMRGEWNEFNPWQGPMGRATEDVLEAIGVTVFRAHSAAELVEQVKQAAIMAYEADGQIAILISQRLLGKKTW